MKYGPLMIKNLFLSGVLSIILGHIAFSQGHGLGLGLVLGEPTGVSCKGWVTHSGAIQLGIGWPSTSHTGGTAISAEYLWHSHIFRSRESFPLSYGLGGIFGLSNDINIFGVRSAFGISWWPHSSSFDIFLELNPTLYLKPSSTFEFDFGFGARYFF
jgi:hypothetical protein